MNSETIRKIAKDNLQAKSIHKFERVKNLDGIEFDLIDVLTEFAARLIEKAAVLELKQVAAVQDESSHWYVIPATLKEEFYVRLENSYTDEFQEGYFEDQFGKYMTGGDLNLVELYAKID